jgi:hypothetical protein
MLRSQDIKELKKSQISILKKVREHIKFFDKTNHEVNSYLPLGNYAGLALLKFWINPFKNFSYRFKIAIKEIYLLSFERNFVIQKKIISNNNKNIIITWGNKENFNSKGDYFDKYYNTNSKKLKNTLWIVLSTDLKKIKKVKNNIIVLYHHKKKFLYIEFIKNFLRITYWKNLNFSHENIVAKKIWETINKFIFFSIKNIYMPYEGQQFQNYIIKRCHEKNLKIKIHGYIHSFPLGLPSNLAYTKNSPHRLFVNGFYQKKYLCQYLNWRKKKIIIHKSLRFLKNKKMNCQIFLPYYLGNSNFVLKKLHELKNHVSYTSIFNCILVKNHPETKNSILHRKLIKKIKKNIIKKNEFIKTNNFSIFIGCSGAIIEALVRGVKVIHISSEPILEIYSSMWEFLSVTEIIKNVYIYKIKDGVNKNNIILIGEQKNLLNEYFLKN